MLEEGCPEFEEVCSETLIMCLCKKLAKDLQGKFRRIFIEGKSLSHQTLGGLSVAEPIPGKQVFTLSVKTAVSWTISTMGKVAPVADLNDPYPGYVSCIAQKLYERGVAMPVPVRAGMKLSIPLIWPKRYARKGSSLER